ncbi:hypothetical protein K440DRAFT_169917 [Wilcoxina mikolae CBS 423.85]|nr:hypothetical protein K440DRAFT_169917 [Wilcoxina mikolae CBS 423.85]
MVFIFLLETMAPLFETMRFLRVCGVPVALLFLAAPIVGGLAAVTLPATVAPVTSSSPDQKQRDGEEFSNNLVSDLAPLLALFGERFAQQFMSFSTSWIDSVIFAMAPLGIITAIVGAVRVGGASWLKSLIGRARETRAAAEVELMSSTSHEVCEIWNGDAIVRVMGTPDIEQFIYFDGLPEQLCGKELPTNSEESAEDSSPRTWAIYTLKEAVEAGLLVERGQRTSVYERLPKWFRKILAALTDNDNVDGDDVDNFDVENGDSSSQRNEKAGMNASVHSILRQRRPHLDEEQALKDNSSALPTASISGKSKRSSRFLDSEVGGRKDQSPHSDQDKSAPNVSLNLGVSKHPLELYAAAIFGVLVQLGVLVVAGMATYYPRLKFRKGGLTVRNYAYPLCGIGILLQSVGMFICASVIEQSTIEQTWVKCDEAKAARMICFWLQRRRVINDQEFDSFAVFAKRPVEFVMTSRRRKARNPKVSYPSPATRFVTASGMAVSVMGFILNFMGLRGLHWLATMAQLAATGIMTIVRAVIRRGISSRPHAVKLEEGFELDWLARAVLKDPKSFGPQYDNPKANSKPTQNRSGEPVLSASTPGLSSIPKNQSNRGLIIKLEPSLRVITGGNPVRDILPDLQESYKTMSLIKTREHLGRLSQWKSPASEPAVAVANAIEVVMNTLFTEEDENSLNELTHHEDGSFTFTWFMDVQFRGPNGQIDDEHDGQVCLSVKKKHGSKKWLVIAEEIEALLSLWLQHAEEAEENDRNQSAGKADDDWLRRKPQQKNMRFLGPDTVALRRDLQWLVSNRLIKLLTITELLAFMRRRTCQTPARQFVSNAHQ